MKIIDNIGYNFSIDLQNSIITNTIHNERDLHIKLDDLRFYSFIGKLDISQDISYVNAELIFNNTLIFGEEPGYPSRIIDFSLVKDGEIYGNYLDYPFLIKGDIQFVLTFDTYGKLTLKAQRMNILIENSIFNSNEVQ